MPRKWLPGALGGFTHCASVCNLVWRKGGRLTGLWKGQPADSNLKTDQGAPFGSWQLHGGQRDEVYLHCTTYNVDYMCDATFTDRTTNTGWPATNTTDLATVF